MAEYDKSLVPISFYEILYVMEQIFRSYSYIVITSLSIVIQIPVWYFVIGKYRKALQLFVVI